MIPYGLILRIAAPVLVAILLWTWGWSAGKAQVQRNWDLATATQVKAQLAATEAARARETALAQQVEAANEARKLDNQKNARIVARLKSDAGKLRDEIASFAGGSPTDTGDACRERAATLGQLLETSLRVSEACAIEGEQVSADLRVVLAAWPR